MKTKTLIAVVLLASACLPRLVPTVPVPGAERFAFAEVAGVRVWASGDAWDGSPSSVDEVLTPLLVTLENHSGHPLRLDTKDFVLIGTSGVRYAALPPLPAETHSEASPTLREGVVLADYHPAVPVHPAPPPRAPPHGVWVVRPSVRFHPGIPVWPGPWLWWDAAYHARWYRSWPMALPSEDMIQRALPDGVLDDGGRVTGFIYFQQVRRERLVRLELQLTDANSGVELGRVTLPFVIHR